MPRTVLISWNWQTALEPAREVTQEKRNHTENEGTPVVRKQYYLTVVKAEVRGGVEFIGHGGVGRRGPGLLWRSGQGWAARPLTKHEGGRGSRTWGTGASHQPSPGDPLTLTVIRGVTLRACRVPCVSPATLSSPATVDTTRKRLRK